MILGPKYFQETLETLAEFQEKIGVERIKELLASVDWPAKTMKMNPVISQENRSRLQKYIKRETPNCSNNEASHVSKDEFSLKNVDLTNSKELLKDVRRNFIFCKIFYVF